VAGWSRPIHGPGGTGGTGQALLAWCLPRALSGCNGGYGVPGAKVVGGQVGIEVMRACFLGRFPS